MNKYLELAERIGDEGYYGKSIILQIENNIVKESHIITPKDNDEDILKGMSQKELDNFIKGDSEHEWEAFELSKTEYDRKIKQNEIGRFRNRLKQQNIDPLERKSQKLNHSVKIKKRGEEGKILSPDDKLKRRADTYKQMLDEKYCR